MTTLLTAGILERLMEAFQQSMQKLLKDLCRDFERNYAAYACSALGLPIDWFRRFGRSFTTSEYSNWKVVGWIESLNDLLYLVDIVTCAAGAITSGDRPTTSRRISREVPRAWVRR